MPQAREELIELQKRWVNDLKARIYETESRHSPELDKYYEEYRREFQSGYERVATRAELVRALSKADIAYFGDYHTLKTAQRTVKTLLDETVRSHGRKLILGLEMLHTKHQRFADQYVAGTLDEAGFLAAIEYEKTWGFEWPNYRVLFDLAREHKCKIIALNRDVDKKDRRKSLQLRDKHAAAIIAAASMMYPDHLVAVLFGDLHTGETHLPRRVRDDLAGHGLDRHDLIVYQNSETLYWKLVSEGKELVVDAVKISKGKYCVMNATPLVKFQSHLNWQEAAGELSFTGLDTLGHEYRGNTDLSQQFGDIVEAIASFLKIDEPELENFSIYTTGDLGFLTGLQERKIYSPEEIENLKGIIARRHSAFFPRARIVYLGSLSVNDAAEMAARFIRFTCVKDQYEAIHEARDGFYVALFDEALGLFGAMIMNSRYRVATIHDHADLLAGMLRKRLSEKERIDRDASRMVIEHIKAVHRMVREGNNRDPMRAIYHLDPVLFRRVTRATGGMLAAQLFGAVNAGAIAVSEVRDLFYRVWKPGEAFNAYIELKTRFAKLPENLRGLGESL